MKLERFTKIVLTFIAILLFCNLASNLGFFGSKQVDASSATFLQIGQSYSFGPLEGKLIEIGTHGWVKLQTKETPQGYQFMWVNTNLVGMIYSK